MRSTYAIKKADSDRIPDASMQSLLINIVGSRREEPMPAVLVPNR
jgi:hypothetical protein